MEQPADKILLKKFLENQCTPQEMKLVSKWLQQPGTDLLLHEIITQQWQENMEKTSEENPDDQQMQIWKQRIRTLVEEADAEKEYIHPAVNKRDKPFFLKYAAIWITMLTGLSALWFFKTQKDTQLPVIAMIEKHNPYGQRSTIVLPDGSIIYLGAGSTIRFPEKFQGRTRDIDLEGEAFFEVVHNAKKAFIVHSADVQTCVLGTSFKIEAFKDHVVKVSVATGKVSVGHLDGSTSKVKSIAVLLPGQNVSWDAATQKAATNLIAINDLKEWKQGSLVFKHALLADMAADMERWYKVKIKINMTRKASEKISGTIPSTISVTDAMKVLSVTGHFKYTIKDSIINIY